MNSAVAAYETIDSQNANNHKNSQVLYTFK